MARVFIGVEGMNSKERAEKVRLLLMGVEGVQRVDATADGHAAVTYDDNEVNAMALVMALRRYGLKAGME